MSFRARYKKLHIEETMNKVAVSIGWYAASLAALIFLMSSGSGGTVGNALAFGESMM
jgi:hypothetical protein